MGDKKESNQADELDEAAEDLKLTDEKADDIRGGVTKKTHWPDLGKKKP